MDHGQTIFPFGKHRGERLCEIPAAYLDWVLGLSDLRPELRARIEAYLKTQAEYDQMDAAPDWKEGREDYDPAKDD